MVGVNLANALSKIGYHVTIIALHKNESIKDRLSSHVEVKILRRRLAFCLPVLCGLVAKIAKEGHLIISTIRNLNIFLAAANYISCRGQARILMREANTYQQLKYGSFIDKISYQLYRKIIPWAYGYAIRVVANSRDTLQDIIDLGPKPTTTEFITIGNPVIANPSKPQLLSRGPRIESGKRTVRIVSVGGLHPQKDFVLALESVKLFMRNGYNVFFEILVRGLREAIF